MIRLSNVLNGSSAHVTHYARMTLLAASVILALLVALLGAGGVVFLAGAVPLLWRPFRIICAAVGGGAPGKGGGGVGVGEFLPGDASMGHAREGESGFHGGDGRHTGAAGGFQRRQSAHKETSPALHQGEGQAKEEGGKSYGMARFERLLARVPDADEADLAALWRVITAILTRSHAILTLIHANFNAGRDIRRRRIPEEPLRRVYRAPMGGAGWEAAGAGAACLKPRSVEGEREERRREKEKKEKMEGRVGDVSGLTGVFARPSVQVNVPKIELVQPPPDTSTVSLMCAGWLSQFSLNLARHATWPAAVLLTGCCSNCTHKILCSNAASCARGGLSSV